MPATRCFLNSYCRFVFRVVPRSRRRLRARGVEWWVGEGGAHNRCQRYYARKREKNPRRKAPKKKKKKHFILLHDGCLLLLCGFAKRFWLQRA